MENIGHFLKFKKLSIKNGRVFKEIDLQLHGQGLVMVQGANGSGKSTIWAILEAIFYSSTPGGHRRDELVKNKKDSSFTVEFSKGKEDWSISYARTKGKWKHTVTVDGKERDYHTIPETTKAAAEALGLSRAEFEGSIHLTQSSQHILIEGKPSERKQYISDFFGIDERYDQVRSAAEGELNAVTKEIEKVSSYSHTLAVLEEEQKQLIHKDGSELKASLELATQRVTVVDSRLTELSSQMTAWKQYQHHWPAASRVSSPEAVKEGLLLKRAELQNSFKQVNEVRSHNEAAKRSNSQLEQLTSSIKSLEAEYQGLDGDYKDEFQRLSNDIAAYQRVSPMKSEFSAYLAEILAVPVDSMEAEMSRLSAESMYESRKLSAAERGECPTCSTKFTTQDIEAQRAKVVELQSAVASLNEDLALLRKRNEKAQRYQYLKQVCAGVLNITQVEISRHGYLSELLKGQGQYNAIKQQLVHLHFIELKPELDSVSITSSFAAVDSELLSVNQCLEAKAKLPPVPQTPEMQITEETNSLWGEKQSLLTKNQQGYAELGKIETENARVAKLKSQVLELQTKLDGLDQLKKDQYFWQKMMEAYGPKGLRVQQLQKIMDTVLKRLPYYTSILFEDKNLSFNHSCDSANIEILAKRISNDEEYTHDISSLSGGEKRSLSVAFVLTLADCVSSNKRSNILILDEVDSNLDQNAQFRFVNHLLPLLKEQYESIFLITHSEEIQQAATYDKIWKVLKTANWSVIEEKLAE